MISHKIRYFSLKMFNLLFSNAILEKICKYVSENISNFKDLCGNGYN